MSSDEEERWAQTLIAITPEDDAVLREIASTTEISARGDVPLDLSPAGVVRRRPLIYKYIMSEDQLGESTKDAENQTYLQGVSIVDIVIPKKDAAMQTMYTRSPCSPFKEQKDIMTSMNDEPTPVLKITRHVQTCVSIDPNAQLHEAIQSLSEVVDDFDVPVADEKDEAESEARGILQLTVCRALWIAEPSVGVRPGDQERLKDDGTQTHLKFNAASGRITVDSETQTGLTCRPKQSNTALLSDYQETKGVVKEILKECFDRGILPRLVATEVIEEIVNRCAGRIKYPMEDQQTQTVATYKTNVLRDEELMRKLRRSVVIDPFESSIVVITLVNDLLREACERVVEDARFIVKDIISATVRRATFIGAKLAEIRKTAEPKSMDRVFEQRRKKIVESMLKKDTETASMQTEFGGVRELIRMKGLKERLCAVCPRPSVCGPCCDQSELDKMANQTDSTAEVPWEAGRMLRTQDILLAYKPCYAITTEPGRNLNPTVQSTRPPPSSPPPRELCSHPLDSEMNTSEESVNTIDVLLQSRKQSATGADSVSGWRQAIDSSLTKPWSIRGSRSTMSGASSVDRHGKSASTLMSSSFAKSNSSELVLQTGQALEILKNTFCTRKRRASVKSRGDAVRKDDEASKAVCPVCVSGESQHGTDKQSAICKNSATNAAFGAHDSPEGRDTSSGTGSSTFERIRSMNVCRRSYVGKSRDEYFKLIPVRCLSDSDS